jgi:NAD(P)-dependent dehydrogenase (short-subunit alcohol dehydrogenase family)
VLRELEAIGMSAVQLDVTNQESINRCKSDVAQITGGRLDVLVNNALVEFLPLFFNFTFTKQMAIVVALTPSRPSTSR